MNANGDGDGVGFPIFKSDLTRSTIGLSTLGEDFARGAKMRDSMAVPTNFLPCLIIVMVDVPVIVCKSSQEHEAEQVSTRFLQAPPPDQVAP